MAAQTNKKELRQSRVREMKNQLILEAALSVFAEKGYHNTRLEDISGEAGFSKATLYNYYKDKEDIFLTLLIERYRHVATTRGLFVDAQGYKKRTLKENLRFNLTINFEELGEHFSFIRTSNEYIFNTLLAIQSTPKGTRNPLQEELLSLSDLLEENLINIFIHAKETKEITSILSAEQIAVFYQSLLIGVIADWRKKGQMGDMEETINNILTFTISGCK